MSGGNWKEMFQAACEGDLEMVKYHVKAGVDMDFAHPEFLSTPLVACILAGQSEVALFFLDSGALPGLWSEFDGMTPLGAAHQRGLKDVELRLRALGVAEPIPAPPARRRFWEFWRGSEAR